jgi:hypothetical protein
MVHDDALPKVTAAMLRYADGMCGRRLRLEHQNHRGNHLGDGRFRVSNQFAEHARVAQVELGPPVAAAFTPLDLEPEERRVYDQAVATYLHRFGDRDARAVDHDQWETEIPVLGVRLVGSAGLPFEDARGAPEIRFLTMGDNRREPADPLAAAATRFGLLRHAAWIGEANVRIVHAELVYGTVTEASVDLAAELDGLHAWLGERVDVITERVREARPHIGLECGRCKFVAGCPAHSDRG